jgi:hypothetical protein
MIKWLIDMMLPATGGLLVLGAVSFWVGTAVAFGIAYGLQGKIMVSVITRDELSEQVK